MATTVDHTRCGIVWSWTCPGVLDDPGAGRMTTQAGYVAARAPAGAGDLELPWDETIAAGHWSHFWSRYMASDDPARWASPDAGWERMVPLRWRHDVAAAGPAGTAVAFTVLVHPHAVTVVAVLDVRRPAEVPQLAATVEAARGERSYARGVAPGNRTLDGLAADLRDGAVGLLAAAGAPLDERMGGDAVSVAAPLAATGDPAHLAVDRADVRRCMAGLAVLGPAGTAYDDRFLVNQDPEHATVAYYLRRGHSLWRADAMVDQPPTDPVGCLLANHTAAVAQVEALAGVVRWAADRVGAGRPVDPAVHPLLVRCMVRLAVLHAGDTTKTYRSEVIRRRVDEVVPALLAVRKGTGLAPEVDALAPKPDPPPTG